MQHLLVQQARRRSKILHENSVQTQNLQASESAVKPFSLRRQRHKNRFMIQQAEKVPKSKGIKWRYFNQKKAASA